MPHLPYRTLGAALLFLLASAAQAQYVWIGPHGTRQYSDRPPPPGTPASKIVKAPGRADPALALAPPSTAASAESSADSSSNPAAGPATSPDGAVKPASGPTGPPTLAEQEAAYRERARAREEAERKRQEDAARQRQLAERCTAAREAQAQLTAGTRIARYDQDGQKTYLSDAERASRSAQVSRVLQDCR